jgi:hypothetical protein
VPGGCPASSPENRPWKYLSIRLSVRPSIHLYNRLSVSRARQHVRTFPPDMRNRPAARAGDPKLRILSSSPATRGKHDAWNSPGSSRWRASAGGPRFFPRATNSTATRSPAASSARFTLTSAPRPPVPALGSLLHACATCTPLPCRPSPWNHSIAPARCPTHPLSALISQDIPKVVWGGGGCITDRA